MAERDEIRAALQPLLEQARAEGKWFWHVTYRQWLTPDEIEREWAQDRWLHGPENWGLATRDEVLAELSATVRAVRRRLHAAEAALTRATRLAGDRRPAATPEPGLAEDRAEWDAAQRW